MSGPFGSSQFMYATDAFAEGSSLRFEDGDSAYLNRTPASAGNRKTWTWSGWVKRGNLGGSMRLFYTRDSSGQNQGGLYFNNDGIKYFARTSNTTRGEVYTPALFRDVSAWYHVVGVLDAANTSFKIYVNGVEQSLTTGASISNVDHAINQTEAHHIGREPTASSYYDGYLANVTFIDGTALDPTSFGEYDGTLWKPKSDTDIQALTFGTNGFYLPFKQTTEAEGFSTVTYTGNGGTQSIEGVGFEPDFVWIKNRSSALDHRLFDSVRGANETLFSNTTSAEYTDTDQVMSFDSSGFTIGADTGVNQSSSNHVAWCWDAGSGSPVSNTDGSITSTVKANTAKGFSIVTFTNPSSGSGSIGHGLSVKPDMIITKARSATGNWTVAHKSLGANMQDHYLLLNGTNATTTSSGLWGGEPTSTVFYSSSALQVPSATMIAYCFHSVSGYSKCSSYTGTGAAGNSITGLGFKPAWIMIKKTNAAEDWAIYDNTRSPVNTVNKLLTANTSDAEATPSANVLDFDSDGFTIQGSGNTINTSGGSYIYLAFADTRDATFFGDTSGNSNNWTPNALNNTDVVIDAPVTGGNFAVMNPLAGGTVPVFSEGNLKVVQTTNTLFQTSYGSFGVASGKWYAEVRLDDLSTNGTQIGVGSYVYAPSSSNQNGNVSGITMINLDNTSSSSRCVIIDGVAQTGSNSGFSFSAGDIIGVAMDIDNDQVSFYKNNTLLGTGNHSLTSVGGGEFFLILFTRGNPTTGLSANFGQDSSFAGNETPQGNTDDNGVGDFYYAPPSGYLALTTGNLPTPTITAPDDYFNTVLYTGDGVDDRAITGVGFQPDWVWLKTRSIADNHVLNDSVRGGNRQLFSNTTDQEFTATTLLKTFDSDGFTLGTDSSANGSGRTLAAWNWLAGGTAVSNTDGSITSTVSANTDAGFSVVGYTGTGSAATVGHGLSQKPMIAFFKNRDTTGQWRVYYNINGLGAGVRYLALNSTSASVYDPNIWQGSIASNTVINIGSAGEVNGSGGRIICYAFHSVEGYSKIGSYTGNGSTDGVYVHLGFRPSWIMVKRTDSANDWTLQDNIRDPHNPVDKYLLASQADAEGTTLYFDFLSNGFKLRTLTGASNASGGTYIFLAFAEAPFKNANAR